MNYSILQLLRSDGSIVVNKALARNIGLNEAILYSELVSLYLHWQKENKLIRLPMSKDRKTNEIIFTQEFFFYCTSEKLEENTTLSKKQQLSSIKKLIALGLIAQINKKLDGKSQRRYFTINPDANLILSFLGENTQNIDSNSAESLDSHRKLQKVTFESYKRELSKVTKGNGNNTNVNNTNGISNTTHLEEKSPVVVNNNKDLIETNTKLKLSKYQIGTVAKWDVEKLTRSIEIFNTLDGEYFALLLKIYKDGAIKSTGGNKVSSKVADFNKMDEHEAGTYDDDEIAELERRLIEKKLSDKS